MENYSSTTESPRSPGGFPFSGQIPAALPSRSDTLSSNGSYERLPPGRWILDFHGSCPRCHHQHNAVQVKVKVSQDASQVSHVHCEKCNGKWAAFGGANTTRISLLSSITMEPDIINEEVRSGIIRMVQRATTVDAPSTSDLHYSANEAVAQMSTQAVDNTPQNRGWGSSTSPGPSSQGLGLSRSRSGKFLEAARRARDIHFPTLRRENLKRLVPGTKQPTRPAKRLQRNAPPGQTLSASTRTMPNVSRIHDDGRAQGRLQTVATAVTTHDLTEPAVSLEADAYLQTLEESELSGLTHGNRVAWGRDNYTRFRSHRNIAQTVHNRSSIVSFQMGHSEGAGIRNGLRPGSRLSYDVYATLGGAETDSVATYPNFVRDTIFEDNAVSHRHSASAALPPARRGVELIRSQSVSSGRRRSLQSSRTPRGPHILSESTTYTAEESSELTDLRAPPTASSSQAPTVFSDMASDCVNAPQPSLHGSTVAGDPGDIASSSYPSPPLENDSNR